MNPYFLVKVYVLYYFMKEQEFLSVMRLPLLSFTPHTVVL